tara:strand:+ start:829 stop:1002 length:174 start_codon:yes stop_codon:yes gene_type:complete
MTQKTYRIEELATNGWQMTDTQHQKLTKERAKEVLDSLMTEGYNPGRLRAIPDGTTD